MPHFGRTTVGDIVIGLTEDDLVSLVEYGGRAFTPSSLGMTVHLVFRPTVDELRECFRGPNGGPIEVTETHNGLPREKH